jgi:MFS family permease
VTRAARVLLACFVCQMGLGFGYVFGATLKHIVADMAWSRAAFAGGSACLLLFMGLAAPVLGSLSERIGARRVASAALFVLALALALASRMQSLAEFYAVSALLGIGMTGVGDVVIGAAAARWVSRGRGLALAFVFVGSNVGGAAVPVFAEAMAARSSWRDALLWLAGAALFVLLPFAAFGLREPEVRDAAIPADGPVAPALNLREALRTRSFWILAGVLFCFYFYYLGVTQHLVAFVSDLGYSDARAAASLSFTVGLGIVAKLGMGLLADRIPARRALLLNFAVLGLGSGLLLVAGAPGLLAAFLVAHGVAVAAENVVVPLVVAECFGVRHLARLYGALMLTLFPGGVLGPIFAGAVFDRFGSYVPAFGTFAVLNALAFAALFALRPETRTEPGFAATGRAGALHAEGADGPA